MKNLFKSFMLVIMLLAVSVVAVGCAEEEQFPVGDDYAEYVSDDYNADWGHPVITVKVKVVGGENKVIYSGTVKISAANPVGIQALKGACEENSISLTENGGFITEIDGYQNDSSTNTYWGFYVNGKMAHLGAGTFQIREGDYLEFNYAEMVF